jgi:hypothetical protein
MQRVPTATGAAPDATNLHFREQPHEAREEDRANRDDTTVSFDGVMKVSGDDAGSDPYNRTGNFKRIVR